MRKGLYFSAYELIAIERIQAASVVFGAPYGAATPKRRFEVVYLSGCFKEAQNIKRWIDTATGKLYMTEDGVKPCNSGFTMIDIRCGLGVYSNYMGDKVRIMEHKNTPEAKEFLDVKYASGKWKGVFKLDVVAGVLYAGDCATAQGHGYELQPDGTYMGFNKYVVEPVHKQVKPKVARIVTTFEVAGWEFSRQEYAEQRAKEHALKNPDFNVQVKRITTEVIGNYIVEEKQVSTKVKSWE